MAVEIIVEDGSGMETATSYIDLDTLHLIWEQYGYKYMNEMGAEQEMQLVNRAATFLDGYKLNWGGQPMKATQALQFPRINLYDKYGNYVDGVPNEIKKAQAVMAYYIDSNGVGSIAPMADAAGNLKSYTDYIGPIRESKEYFANTSNSGNIVRIPEIDALLKRFNTGRYGGMDLNRMGGAYSGNYRTYYGL